MKRVAISQSNYVPWRGYFDMINMVDEFILYDDAQYTRRDWRNRNKLKTSRGPQWVTIPVEVKGKYHQRIRDTVVSDTAWRGAHWTTIRHNYRKARFFEEFRERFEDLYLSYSETELSLINHRFILAVCEILDIKTRISWSMDFDLASDGANEKLLELCKRVEADIYISGPSALPYLDETMFQAEGVAVEWIDYNNYSEYPQLHPPFSDKLSILDTIFNTGYEAKKYMKSFLDYLT
jgi:hypothetical protein